MTAIRAYAHSDPFSLIRVLCDSLRASVDRTYTYPVLRIWTDVSQYSTFERDAVLIAIEQCINNDNVPHS